MFKQQRALLHRLLSASNWVEIDCKICGKWKEFFSHYILMIFFYFWIFTKFLYFFLSFQVSFLLIFKYYVERRRRFSMMSAVQVSEEIIHQAIWICLKSLKSDFHHELSFLVQWGGFDVRLHESWSKDKLIRL